MELQFRKTALSCLGRRLWEVQNQELTQEIRLTDAMPDIGRVLSSWGQMILRSKEWRSGAVTVTGGVMVWILYAPEDGSEPRCVDGWIPFQLRWNVPDTDREGPVRITPMIRFVDGRTVSARKFMARVGVVALAEALYPEEIYTYTPEELPEDVQVLRRTYPVRLPKESGEKTFLLDEELTLHGGSAQPEKLLSYTIQPDITDCRVSGNKVVFRGSGNLHLIYICREGRIRTADLEVPYSQYADLEQIYGPDARADIRMGTTSLELDMNEEGQLRLKCGLVAQYLVDDRELLDLTEDAYSPRREVEPECVCLMVPAILEDRTEYITAEQNASGQFVGVADAAFYGDFPRQRHTDEGISLEVPGMFQLLCYGENGVLQPANVRWEGNLNLPAGDGCRVEAWVSPVERPQAVNAAEGMNLSQQLMVQISTVSEQGIPMITGLELGEMQEPLPGRPSLILCRPGGDDLWKIAKRTGSTVDAIRQANRMEEEPSGDRMLLIPVS